MNKNFKNNFTPFISADKMLPEFTGTSIFLGILLAVVFGAANAYLGLKVGMTISASIPAAVISMGLIRGILKKESILENNMVQTIGSAGESLAAGAIFTLPALYIWTEEWNMGVPNLLTITAIALCGGILGVFFVVPLRKALIVNEHGILPYPEGTACSEVLLAGEEGGEKAKACFTGLSIGALYKFIADGLKLFPSRIETTISRYTRTAIGADVVPALLGVGFIIGPRISGFMLAGAIIGWLGLIPLIANIGSMGDVIIYPASVPIKELGYWGIWDYYIRYVGAGAVAFGGIFSLIKSLPLIFQTFKDAIKDYSSGIGGNRNVRTDRDMSMKIVLIGSLLVILAMMMLPAIPVGFGGALLIAIFGFFFATVSARIVGLVGSSSNPVSGMTIATLIITAIIFKATGNDGHAGMIGTLTVGAIICIITSMAGDTSQDLKTGFLVGATPYKQQYGELLGVLASAFAIGFVLTLLNNVWGFGSNELPAPQATLMRLVVEGVIGGHLPWIFVFVGVGIGIAIQVLGLPVLPVAIGLYLPIHLSSTIMIGGFIRGILDKELKLVDEEDDIIKAKINSGILYGSGLIAGEGLVGIALAVFAWREIDLALNIHIGQIGALIFFTILTFTLVKFSILKEV
ncbi:OPT family oligopeptide transporter [Paramaledivibacter caminithermalis]|uniref:Putative oligopeptide transporter, OPT family n=1 Tax=Paramaledivibacter caminithermalis (strain DSM 15212 / CIP 107654 / DViRD3) TaxID=1121301 RepID=A0A1M6TA48_PARC5|nr:oligopeptide transporter, OPT family [Paramaledivibacter caminithermalis]SHK53719.1 putative oligopeptide transporter, OPT family [Paramaledivibacter caminithermalis DSM 15212]